ncbi:hypothetical protein A0H81_06966 [Grifola frondosa]|uniref:Uncharacterized protein n=1 Tax=Grifola frondosa TaxID=5627 RepID=A0A1C7M775_GRIFR|nr:hypothetical protein A0H81_06966 [Grifola frondosa]
MGPKPKSKLQANPRGFFGLGNVFASNQGPPSTQRTPLNPWAARDRKQENGVEGPSSAPEGVSSQHASEDLPAKKKAKVNNTIIGPFARWERGWRGKRAQRHPNVHHAVYQRLRRRQCTDVSTATIRRQSVLRASCETINTIPFIVWKNGILRNAFGVDACWAISGLSFFLDTTAASVRVLHRNLAI